MIDEIVPLEDPLREVVRVGVATSWLLVVGKIPEDDVGKIVGITPLEELCPPPPDDVCCVGLTVGKMVVGRIVVDKTLVDWVAVGNTPEDDVRVGKIVGIMPLELCPLPDDICVVGLVVGKTLEI